MSEKELTEPVVTDDLAILDGIAYRWRVCYLADPKANKIGVREVAALDRAIEALRKTHVATSDLPGSPEPSMWGMAAHHQYTTDAEAAKYLIAIGHDLLPIYTADQLRTYAAESVSYWHEMWRAANARAEGRPDLFWDDDDPERARYSIGEVVSDRWEGGAEHGDIITIQQAIRLPNIDVRIVADEDGDYDYVIVAPAAAQAVRSEASEGES